ncbi:hypothetical protein [Lacipirellula sp.]|uniref:hypothetical protein n=1 Tax=Lacipirellula sp. TaxID=2691419 RepID=UPI003D0A9D96
MGQMLSGYRLLVAVGATASALTAASLFAQEQTTASIAVSAKPKAYATANLAAERIESALNQQLKASISEVEAPLNQILQVLSEDYEIPILFDAAALDAVAASPETEVTIEIANVSLRSALDLIIKSAGEDLTYIIDKEVLLITTQEEAEKRLEVVVYRVDDLLDGDEATCERLIEVIVASVEHESWMENGTGEGEALSFPPGMIVISQTQRVHTGVSRLLDHMRTAKQGIIADGAGASATASTQPVTRSINLNDKVLADSEEARSAIRDAVKKSVNWQTEAEGVDRDEFFLYVLPNRVLVRHVPEVVSQVARVVRRVSPLAETAVGNYGNSGLGCGGLVTAAEGEGGGLVAPPQASENGGQR